MEITSLTNKTVKIKGKKASLVIDPQLDLKTKTSTDAVLLTKRAEPFDLSKVENQRVVIDAPGEFEVEQVKISGFIYDEDLIYDVGMDGINILILKSGLLKKFQDTSKDYHILLLNTDSVVDSSLVTSIAPRVLILYGEKAGDFEKLFGKEDTQKTSKFLTTLDKLPQEMQILMLG